MTDALSAAGLLLAMIALIFGAWWPRLTYAAGFGFADSKPNRKEERGPIWAILIGQAAPLMLGAVAAALVFAPRAWRLTADALACDCASLGRLNDVAAAFVVSEALLCLIAAAVVVQAVRIFINVIRSY